MNATVAPSPAPSRQTTLRYLPGLDGLRGISVLAVIVFHHYFLFGSERGWLPGGFLGVEVFFVVSGYLITSLLLAERRETGRISLKHFWLRRARRLLPALYLLLAGVIAYSLLFLPDSIATLKGDVLAALTYTSNWWQVIANRSYAVTAGRPELLKHLWSLAIEEQFYLLWPPLLIVGLRRLGRARMLSTTVLCALLSTLLLAVCSYISINFAYYSTFTRLSGLLLGSALAFVFAPYRIRGTAGHGARIALNIAGAAGLLYLAIAFHEYTYPPTNTGHLDRSVFMGGFLLIDLATLLVIAAAVHPAADVGRLLGCKPLQYVGLRSYSLYLWHYPIFCVTRPRVDFDHFFHLHGWPVFVLRMVLTFGAAEISYRFVETPIRRGALSRYRTRLHDAHGATRRRLVRSGAVVFGSLALVAILLGAGLAGAQPQRNALADGPDNGRVVDPEALAKLRQAPPVTSPVSTRGTVTKATPGRRTTPTTKPSGPPAHVLAIGDSVMLGAKQALLNAIPGIGVDAVKSRQFGEAVHIISVYGAALAVPPVVVIHLGTNGRATDGAIDQIMTLLGPQRQVYFVTARVPRVWEAEVNDALHRAAQRFKNVHVLDWHNYAGCHDDWFVNDGFHLQPPGRVAYANFILAGISGHPLTVCKK